MPQSPVMFREPTLIDRRFLPWTLGALLACLTQSAALIFIGRSLREVFDRGESFAGSGVFQAILIWTAVGAASVGLLRALSARLGAEYAHALRLQLFDAVSREAGSSGNTPFVGAGADLLLFSGDLNAVRQWLTVGVVRSICSAIMILAGAGLLYTMDPTIAWLTLGILTFGVALTWWASVRLESRMAAVRRNRGRLANYLGDVLPELARLSRVGRVDRERERLERRSAAALRSSWVYGLWSGALRGALEWNTRILLVVVIFVGVAPWNSAAPTMGELVAMLAVIGQLGGPARRLGRSAEYWRNARVARRRIRKILRRGVDSEEGFPAPGGAGTIEIEALRHSCLRIPGRFTISPGERIAICGATGQGKSTLLAVLAGVQRPESGEARINGVNIAEMRAADRARFVGFASFQEPLFPGSIDRNIRLRDPGATPGSVRKACRRSGVDALISRWPDGLKTRVGSKSLPLSNGETARVMLASAALGEPPILALDEIDAAMDRRAIRRLTRLLERYPGTVVFATHRKELIRRADRVWRLREGGIQEDRLSKERTQNKETLN